MPFEQGTTWLGFVQGTCHQPKTSKPGKGPTTYKFKAGFFLIQADPRYNLFTFCIDAIAFTDKKAFLQNLIVRLSLCKEQNDDLRWFDYISEMLIDLELAFVPDWVTRGHPLPRTRETRRSRCPGPPASWPGTCRGCRLCSSWPQCLDKHRPGMNRIERPSSKATQALNSADGQGRVCACGPRKGSWTTDLEKRWNEVRGWITFFFFQFDALKIKIGLALSTGNWTQANQKMYCIYGVRPATETRYCCWKQRNYHKRTLFTVLFCWFVHNWSLN